jgi:hypothetical protein
MFSQAQIGIKQNTPFVSPSSLIGRIESIVFMGTFSIIHYHLYVCYDIIDLKVSTN